jgi:hypothetical protein
MRSNQAIIAVFVLALILFAAIGTTIASFALSDSFVAQSHMRLIWLRQALGIEAMVFIIAGLTVQCFLKANLRQMLLWIVALLAASMLIEVHWTASLGLGLVAVGVMVTEIVPMLKCRDGGGDNG